MAAVRGAECLLELGYAGQCVEWIELAKKTFAVAKETEENGNVTEVEREQINSLEKVKEKAEQAERKETEAKKRLLKALEERKLNFRPRLPFKRPELMDWSLLEVNLAQTPEVGQVDVLTDCDETSQVGSVLRPMLENPAEWDKDHKF
ncbi:hypothetical protein OESDEN_23153, partial [Oesophagostomum dentatum]